MIDATYLDRHVGQLFEVMERLHTALTKAGIPYRIVGGMAVYFQVIERHPAAGRFTNDVDVAVDRKDLQRIAQVAEEFGFRYRNVAGADMLVDALQPKATSAVHMVFVDMDAVGLITLEIESTLPEALRRRLQQVREEERQSTGAE